mmetsp:Transcript_8041/g.15751  ORF Transcript_8041/g.15751 Transcript_8041/m.15751 type:complete len:205 (-) Transcript_8041:260-874(-)
MTRLDIHLAVAPCRGPRARACPAPGGVRAWPLRFFFFNAVAACSRLLGRLLGRGRQGGGGIEGGGVVFVQKCAQGSGDCVDVGREAENVDVGYGLGLKEVVHIALVFLDEEVQGVVLLQQLCHPLHAKRQQLLPRGINGGVPNRRPRPPQREVFGAVRVVRHLLEVVIVRVASAPTDYDAHLLNDAVELEELPECLERPKHGQD